MCDESDVQKTAQRCVESITGGIPALEEVSKTATKLLVDASRTWLQACEREDWATATQCEGTIREVYRSLYEAVDLVDANAD